MKILSTIFSLTLLVSGVQAASVVIQAGATPAVLLSSSGAQITTATVQFGFFKGVTSTSTAQVFSDLRVALSGNTLADRSRINTYISENFVPIGTGANLGTAAYSLSDVAGGGKTVTGSVTGITFVSATGGNVASQPSASGLVTGTKLFAILTDTSAVSTATQMAVVSGSWNSPGSTSPSMNIVFGSVDTQDEIYRGTLGSIQFASFIPEPSTFILGVIGCAFGLRRRRA
jgi:hypothetical protein